MDACKLYPCGCYSRCDYIFYSRNNYYNRVYDNFKFKGVKSMTINDFARIGLFVLSSSVFALGTGIMGVLISDFTDDWSLSAWFIAILVYGITFAILFEMR